MFIGYSKNNLMHWGVLLVQPLTIHQKLAALSVVTLPAKSILKFHKSHATNNMPELILKAGARLGSLLVLWYCIVAFLSLEIVNHNTNTDG